MKIIKNMVLGFCVMIIAACGGGDGYTAVAPTQPEAGTTADNPLVVEGLDLRNFDYDGRVGTAQLYLKITNLAISTGIYGTTLSGMTDDADLYAYSDAYVTETCASTNTGTVNETCRLDSNQDGEIFFRIDGSKTSAGTNFNLNGND